MAGSRVHRAGGTCGDALKNGNVASLARLMMTMMPFVLRRQDLPSALPGPAVAAARIDSALFGALW